jgi:hypothetical protein
VCDSGALLAAGRQIWYNLDRQNVGEFYNQSQAGLGLRGKVLKNKAL